MRFLQHFAGMLMLCVATCAQAQDRITARAYIDDPGGQKTVAEIRQMPAKPFSGALSHGFTSSATWLRLSVAPEPNALPGDTLILRIRPSYLDQLELYDPLDQSGRARRAGDLIDWSKAEVKSLGHGFVIPASTEPRQIWLRMVTTSSSFIHVQALPPDEFQRTNQIQEMIYGLMLGVLLLFLLWGSLHWLLWREALIAVFTGSQLMAIIFSLTLLGYGRLLLGTTLSPQSVQILANLIFCSYVLFSLIFHFIFLREFQPSKLLHQLIPIVALVAYVSEVGLIFSDDILQALRINAILVSLTPVLLLGTAISCKAWRGDSAAAQVAIPRWALLLYYVLVSSVVVVASSHAFGLIDAPELNLHLHLLHGLLSGAVLVAILQIRALRNEKVRNLTSLRAHAAAQQIEIEREKAQRQGRFMAVFADELKSSLSVLKMLFGGSQPNSVMLSHGRRAMHGIDDLIDRCLLTQKFEDNQVAVEFDYFRIDELIDEIVRKSPDSDRFVVHYEERTTIKSDRQLLKLVISNLLDNALKYSPGGSVVRLRVGPGTQQQRRGCEFGIENDAVMRAGVAELPDATQIFKKYYRANSALRHPGAGLGLYLVANFVRLIGGVVRYEPEDTRVRFTVWLPT